MEECDQRAERKTIASDLLGVNSLVKTAAMATFAPLHYLRHPPGSLLQIQRSENSATHR